MSRFRARRALCALVSLGLAASLGVSLAAAPTSAHAGARATDNGAWSVTPTPPKGGSATPRDYFVIEADPGTRIKDKVRIQNWTKKPITFHLYGADAYNTTQDGFFALKQHTAEMSEVGAWTKPLVRQVRVAGQTQVDVPITIKVPKNATPGDHAGGVVAMNLAVESVQQNDQGMQVGIQRAIGARVYIRVSGPTTPALEVSAVTLHHDRGALPWQGSGAGTVEYTVENTGNLRLSPQAVVEISGPLGSASSVTRPQIADLLPGQKVRLRQQVTDVPRAGRVTAEVRLSAPDGVEAEGRASVWLLPWAGLLVLLVLGAAALWLWRRLGQLARRRAEALDAAPLITVWAEG